MWWSPITEMEQTAMNCIENCDAKNQFPKTCRLTNGEFLKGRHCSPSIGHRFHDIPNIHILSFLC